VYFNFLLPVLKSEIFKVIAFKRVEVSCCSTLNILHGRCVFPALPDLPLCFSSWFVNITLNVRKAEALELLNRSNNDDFSLFKIIFIKVEKPRSFHFLMINRSSILCIACLRETHTICTNVLRVAVTVNFYHRLPLLGNWMHFRRHMAYIAHSWTPITRQRYATIAS